MLELIEVNAVLEAMFNEMREAARDWDGSDPFREMPAGDRL
jgi:hypothetical protein